MSAKKLYDELITSGIVGATGETNFELNGVKTRVNDSSIVGNVIQEWLQSFMDEKGISYRLLPNTQKFPDFLMNPENDHDGLLEVKCFKKDPNFDVANFIAYCTSLTTSPYRLDAALEKVIDSNPLANHIQRGWFQKIQKLYTEQTGKEL